MQSDGQISGKVTRERRDAAGGEKRRVVEIKIKEREIVRGRKEGIGESEAGNETVLGQS